MLRLPQTNFGKITACWSAIVVLGISGFVWAKNDILNKRFESMKVRERMRNSNVGEYEIPKENRRF